MVAEAQRLGIANIHTISAKVSCALLLVLSAISAWQGTLSRRIPIWN